MLRLDSRRKSKEESWKEINNVDHAGHLSTVIVVLLAIIDASVIADNLYGRMNNYWVVKKASY